MKNEENFEKMMRSLGESWDCSELRPGHEIRFEDKLDRERPVRKLWQPIAAAAAVIIALGLLFVSSPKPTPQMKFASEQTREADSVFNSMIGAELEKLRARETPANKAIIEDAFVQLEAMESDYEKIKRDLIGKGESEQVIHALIINLQTRISFLQQVLHQIDTTNNLKKFDDEKSI